MKKVLIVISVVLVVFLGGVLSVPYLVDVNDYKDEIKATIKNNTGRDIEINGKITLSVFPDIALRVKDVVALSPIEGDKPLLSIDELILNVKIIPLIKSKVDVSSFKLNKPIISMHILADGTNNWEVAPTEESAKLEETASEHFHEPILEDEEIIEEIEIPDEFDVAHDGHSIQKILRFEELKITNGVFVLNDEQNNKSIKIEDINLDTSFNLDDNPFLLSGKLDIFKDKKKGNFSLKGQYYLQNTQYNFEDLAINFDDIAGSSNLIFDLDSYKPTIKLALYFSDIDLNKYSIDVNNPKTGAKDNKNAAQNVNENKDTSWSEEPIDLSILNKIDAHLSFKSNKISYQDIAVNKVMVNSYLRNNKLTINLKEIAVYNGNVAGEVVIDNSGGPINIRKNINITDIDLRTLPYKDGFIKTINGKLNANISTLSSGKSQKQLIRNTGGTASFKIGEGYIEGVDLFSMVNNVTAAFNIGSVSNKTRFDEISADFKINKGVAQNDNLVLKSDIMNFTGSGKIDLIDSTIDYRLVPKYSQNFKDEDKKGPTVPVLVTGKISQPKFRLEIASIVEDLIRNPKGPENLVNQLKRDFKGIKKNIMNDFNKDSIKDLKDIFN